MTFVKFHSQDRMLKDWVFERGWEEGYGSEEEEVDSWLV